MKITYESVISNMTVTRQFLSSKCRRLWRTTPALNDHFGPAANQKMQAHCSCAYLQCQMKHSRLLKTGAGEVRTNVTVRRSTLSGPIQYADDDFDLLIVAVGWNDDDQFGNHALKHCIFVYPKAVVQERCLMAMPGRPSVHTQNDKMFMSFGSDPFIGSTLHVVQGKGMGSFLQRSNRLAQPSRLCCQYICITPRYHVRPGDVLTHLHSLAAPTDKLTPLC